MLSRYLNTDVRARMFNWNAVYIYNLLVPLAFGFTETQGDARLGMFTGVAILWYVGRRLAVRSPLLSTALLWGGTFVALCQFMPIGHLMVGTHAVEWSRNFEMVPHEYGLLTSFLGGLSATCITGGVCMLVGLLIGMMVLALSNLCDGWAGKFLETNSNSSPIHSTQSLTSPDTPASESLL